MKTIVRPREGRDVAQLAEVLVRVHAADGYPVEGVADPVAWLHPPREMAAWTAEFNGSPIGHISLVEAAASDDAAATWQCQTNGTLDQIALPVRLFVDPPNRGHGAASGLMTAAHEYASEHRRQLVFDVMEKDRTAIRLYDILGCKRIGTIQHHSGGGTYHPAIVYVAPTRWP